MPRETDTLLLARASQLRDWIVFALAASLPAIAVGVLGFRALRGEEDAIRREAVAALDADAQRLALRFDAELRRAVTQLREAEFPPRGEVSEASLASSSPPFAQPVVLDEQHRLLVPHSASAFAQAPPAVSNEVQASCDRWADQLARGGATRAELIRDCQDARSWDGRWLWPVVALQDPDPGLAEPVVQWLESHAAWLSTAEREVTGEEVRRARIFDEAQRKRAAGALDDALTAGDHVAAALRTAAASHALGRGPSSEGLVSWSGDGSAAVLRTLDDGRLVGFVADKDSVRASMSQGWAGVSPSHRVMVVAGPAGEDSVGTPRAVAHLAPGLSVVITLARPELLAEQASRSRWILGAIAIVAALLALAVAVVLFARMRAARRLGELRTGFVSAVSHELRTPIASVRMLSELLEQGRVEDGERAEVVEALARESRRLGETVDRLLGFSRMAAGRYVIDRRDASVREAVVQAVDAWEERHKGEPAIVRTFRGDDRASVDAGQIRLAVDNLLANASKYAPGGTPYEVVVAGEGDGVRVEVADRGPGIARRDQERIFKPFERGDDRLSQATEGSGIGLALVTHVARAHGGNVRVISAPGQGARFIMWIPRSGT